MTIKSLKWAKLIAWIGSGACAPIYAAVSVLYPTHANAVLAIGAALVSVAGALGVLFPAPAQQVVANAPIVTLAGDKTGATTVTTDSTLPIAAPQKGA
jgi:hypothetical protein